MVVRFMVKKIFVSGCFDILHPGHISFLKNASKYGELYVALGSDKTIKTLKNRKSIFVEKERVYMVKALRYVKDAFISSGVGILDFKKELQELNPTIFIVNEDGNNNEKRELCKSLGIQYKVLKRIPPSNLLIRNTTSLKENFSMPYRIDLAGGWLDQPWVSKYHPGAVLTISIDPIYKFNLRSGMATSTRKKAIEMWGDRIPSTNNPITLAKMLFSYENPPGKKEIAGSQDSLGIVLPSINYLYYNGDYWPEKIKTLKDDEILKWLESVIFLIPLNQRGKNYDVLKNTHINKTNAKELSLAAENCFNSIKKKDAQSMGKAVTDSFNAQIKMFPKMVNKDVLSKIEKYKSQSLGWKLSGAGGGGYLILISDKKIVGGIQIKIRRS